MKKPHAQVWGGHLSADPDALMVSFCAGRDVVALPMADAELLPCDLWTNRAHAIMLQRQGIIDSGVLTRMLSALNALEEDAAAGRFALDPALEDVHVNVERYISQREGADVGGRLHTGRSRNDQIACDMRLYLRAAALSLAEGLSRSVTALLEQASAHTETVMPGFTHHQPAMITTWGHWLTSHAQALCRDLERTRFAFDLLNRSPLGAAAAFGTSWPIDRELSAELLAFDRVENNTLDAIGSRGEMESQLANTLVSVMNHLAVLAQDLILLSHPYWGMVALHDRYVTGSSIMPQKRNPDVAEVVKGKTAWAVGMAAGLMALPKGYMSGFNRDSQWSKYAVLDIVRECLPAPLLLADVVSTLTVNTERMRERLNEGYLAAADFADVLARTLGLPFRTCYEIAAVAVRKSGDAGVISPAAARDALTEAGHDPAPAEHVLADLADPARVVGWRSHTGAPAPDAVKRQIEALQAECAQQAAFVPLRRDALAAAHERCRTYRA